VRPLNPEAGHERPTLCGLLSKVDRFRGAAAGPVADPVIGEEPVAGGEGGLRQEGREPIEAGTVMYEHHGFSGASHVIPEFDSVESCPIHLFPHASP
jgi:hypothetical protein